MDIIRFYLSGKQAHFRKYYANNTALSYFLPPRTTLMGILAARLGYEKDSYYEFLHSRELRLGVGIVAPLKKSFHRLNLLMIKNTNDFRGRNGRVQTPFEVVSGQDWRRDAVRYAVYVAPVSGRADSFEAVRKGLFDKEPTYTLSLGPANMIGYLEAPRMFSGAEVEEKTLMGESVALQTAVNAQWVNALDWKRTEKRMIEEELMPADFLANGNREVGRMIRTLYATDGRLLPIQMTGTCYQLTEDDQSHHITFLE